MSLWITVEKSALLTSTVLWKTNNGNYALHFFTCKSLNGNIQDRLSVKYRLPIYVRCEHQCNASIYYPKNEMGYGGIVRWKQVWHQPNPQWTSKSMTCPCIPNVQVATTTTKSKYTSSGSSQLASRTSPQRDRPSMCIVSQYARRPIDAMRPLRACLHVLAISASRSDICWPSKESYKHRKQKRQNHHFSTTAINRKSGSKHAIWITQPSEEWRGIAGRWESIRCDQMTADSGTNCHESSGTARERSRKGQIGRTRQHSESFVQFCSCVSKHNNVSKNVVKQNSSGKLHQHSGKYQQNNPQYPSGEEIPNNGCRSSAWEKPTLS